MRVIVFSTINWREAGNTEKQWKANKRQKVNPKQWIYLWENNLNFEAKGRKNNRGEEHKI